MVNLSLAIHGYLWLLVTYGRTITDYYACLIDPILKCGRMTELTWVLVMNWFPEHDEGTKLDISKKMQEKCKKSIEIWHENAKNLTVSCLWTQHFPSHSQIDRSNKCKETEIDEHINPPVNRLDSHNKGIQGYGLVLTVCFLSPMWYCKPKHSTVIVCQVAILCHLGLRSVSLEIDSPTSTCTCFEHGDYRVPTIFTKGNFSKETLWGDHPQIAVSILMQKQAPTFMDEAQECCMSFD